VVGGWLREILAIFYLLEILGELEISLNVVQFPYPERDLTNAEAFESGTNTPAKVWSLQSKRKKSGASKNFYIIKVILVCYDKI
jgi:hypothetical protein